MKRLIECPSDVTCDGRRSWRGSLCERKGGVALEVTADRPFALHLLDDDELMGAGVRCDGLLVSELTAEGNACFIELKGAIDPDAPDQPFDQIAASIGHFAPKPEGTDHGEDHHALWRAGDDRPSAPRGRGALRELVVGTKHGVAGAVVVVRGGSRHLPQTRTVAGRNVFVAVIQRHGERGRVKMTLDEIEEAISPA